MMEEKDMRLIDRVLRMKIKIVSPDDMKSSTTTNLVVPTLSIPLNEEQ